MNRLVFLLITLLFFNCETKTEVDLIVTNANIYTVNDQFDKAEAFAVLDGKFLAVGNSEEILSKYASIDIVDAEGQTITPGFIDAHCHFVGLGLAEQKVRLEGTKSYDEVLDRLIAFQKEKKLSFITGRGWDQNDWDVKKLPNKYKLDSVFPDTPVAIRRVDGHAMLLNQAAINLTTLDENTHVEGGEIVKENGELTGLLIDQAMRFVGEVIPEPSLKETVLAIKDAEKICFDYGLTTVDDAGLPREAIHLIDSLQQIDELKIRVYAMASAYKENLDYFLDKGIIKTDRLNVRSFKFYADGALGSRGAMLREPYSDKHNHYGLLVNSIETLHKTAIRIANSDYQMNTHAIGDSANHAVLQAYKSALKGKKDRRWKVEHAQIISPEDFDLFDDIIPSVQPTHATSDMYWAEDRVGPVRIKGAYAFKQLLDKYGKVALGTDFPVEHVSPFYTFYAAVARQDLEQFPEGGFQMENALTREESLKGMTIWAAFSNFEENEKGSIEAGKFADFIILDKDIMETDIHNIPDMKVINTYVSGEKVK
jgi:predicted amidohydrolase YtcJ